MQGTEAGKCNTFQSKADSGQQSSWYLTEEEQEQQSTRDASHTRSKNGMGMGTIVKVADQAITLREQARLEERMKPQ